MHASITIRRSTLSKVAIFLLVPGTLGLDIINGIAGAAVDKFSIGALLRAAITCGAAIFLMAAWRRHPILVLVLALISTLALMGVWHGTSIHSNISVYRELNLLAKLLYAPLLSVLLVSLYRGTNYIDHQMVAYQVVILGGLVLAGGVLLGPYFGYSNNPYKDFGFGNKGIMMSQNEVGLGLLMSATITWHAFLSGRYGWLTLLAALAQSLALFSIGSRTGTFGAVAAPLTIFVMGWHTRQGRPGNNRIRKILLALGLAATTIPVMDAINSNTYLVNKFLLFFETWQARGDLQNAALDAMADRPMLAWFVGEGGVSFSYRIATLTGFSEAWQYQMGKNAEVDWIDLTGYYGAIVAVLVYLLYGFFWWRWFRAYFFARQEWAIGGALALLVFILHSLVGGHAVMAPIPGTMAAAIIAIPIRRMIMKSSPIQRHHKQIPRQRPVLLRRQFPRYRT